jgi:arylsulfatase
MVVFWPARIKDAGGIRTQFENITDVTPTILEAAGIPQPTSVNGVKQQPMNGVSMLSTFASPSAPPNRTTQYFEMIGNRAIYHEGWIAASRSGLLPWIYSTAPEAMMQQPWELYHLDTDFSEAYDLAKQDPTRLTQLRQLFDSEAKKNHVYPLDPRIAGRQERPSSKHFTFYSRSGHLYVSLTPQYENHSHTITAHIDIPKQGANGVLIADGADSGGFSLFIKDGRPTYTYNYFQRNITTITSPDPLPPGPTIVSLQFTYDGGGLGKGALVTLYVNDRPVAKARIDHTVPIAFSFEDTFDIGEDSASAVGDYESPFPFTGIIDHINFDILN